MLREANGVPNQVLGVAFRRLPPKLVDRLAFATRSLLIGDLSKFGLPKPDRGVYTRAIEDDVIPIIDVGLIDCVKSGKVEVVGALEGFDGPDAILAGGERIEPDAVVVATGWRRGLEPVVGHLGVLGAKGRPVVNGADTHPNAPDLYFTGYVNPISGMFRELNIDARRIAKAIARERARRGPLAAREELQAAAALA